MSIQAVIWDMGGVLVRTENRSLRQELATRLGILPEELYRLVFDSESARQATLGKISTAAHWENVRAELNLPAEEFPRVPDEFWGGDYLDEELVDYIRLLRPSYRMALLSNAWDELRDLLVHKWKMIDAFDVLVISAEVGVAKPDPRIYHLALERLEVEPGEAVFVDDFAENLESARAVGLHTILFQNPEQTRADLERLLGNEKSSSNILR
jgi:epoxide hydrolase-like predicted phosphatase